MAAIPKNVQMLNWILLEVIQISMKGEVMASYIFSKFDLFLVILICLIFYNTYRLLTVLQCS